MIKTIQIIFAELSNYLCRKALPLRKYMSILEYVQMMVRVTVQLEYCNPHSIKKIHEWEENVIMSLEKYP